MPRPEYSLSAPVHKATAHKRRKAAAMRAGVWRPWVDPEPAARRLRQLRAAGWSRNALFHATGVSVICIERLVCGQRTKIRPDTERRILQADLHPRNVPRHLLVSSAGTQRRIGALAFMCWSYEDMARESGLARNVFERAMHRSRVNAGIAADVAALYDRLWWRKGLTPRIGTIARKNGRHGPLAWDDHTIDDPTARPIGSEVIPCQRSHE